MKLQPDKNTTSYTLRSQSLVIPANVLWLGAQENAVIARWTAPESGDYAIIGSFSAIDLDTDNAVAIRVAILQDGTTSLFSDTFDSFGVDKSFNLNRTLSKGATIDFAAAYTTTADSDNIGLKASIKKIVLTQGRNLD